MAANSDFVENEEFYKNLLLSLEKDGPNLTSSTNDSGKFIIPKPGFVIKIKNDTGEKIFMNVLSSSELPPPKDISEHELQQLIDNPDATQFRIPLALGDPHAETDKSGNGIHVIFLYIIYKCRKKFSNSTYLLYLRGLYHHPYIQRVLSLRTKFQKNYSKR